MKPPVSLIIINYNTPELIQKTVNTIIENTTYENYNIIIIDNCSTDNSWDAIKTLTYQHQTHLMALQTHINLGYGRACNIGARLSNSRYFCFMNSDVYPTTEDKGWLDTLIQTYTEYEDVGIVAPKLVNPDGLIVGAGVHELEVQQDYWGHEDDGTYDLIEECLSICGACFVVDRNAFFKAGGFDPHYFHYYEETDLAMAMKALQFKVIYNGKSKLIHEHMGTTKDVALLEQYAAMSRAYFMNKWSEKEGD